MAPHGRPTTEEHDESETLHMTDGRLRDKVALITGASRGQGAAQARLFAREGAHVFACDVLDEEGAAVADGVFTAGGRIDYVHLDVSSEGDWDAAIARIESSAGGLHVVVNNAGIAGRYGLMETSLEQWDQIFAVNLRGIAIGLQRVAPVMRRSGGGAIVNTGSIAGMTGHFATAYSASKWGLRGLSKAAAMEFVDWGIRVNMLHPGAVDTPIIADETGFARTMSTMTPMGRMGTAEELAAVALFLVSDDSAYITGVDLAADGGFTNLAAYRAVLNQTTISDRT